ncbi:hypothetical protein TPCV302_03740 [Cutibacterium avidum]|uniref:Pseudouridylate synthase n=1 Tax=Cutibacterium avidum ATCC 25577 TaxID=997355 RepID=G4CWA0_9ACTN|nr:pseudouridylate synthase [Cutibacterium avidum ATCC 25577]BCQ06064.1 hypothetical protein TPCV14_21080 [Cutibacterium avidum]BDY00982.1 hypothetical protein TPCV302_03740 [Cutibacterium avidum]
MFKPVPSPCRLIQFGDTFTVHLNFPGIGDVQTGEQIDQRALPRSALPHEGV